MKTKTSKWLLRLAAGVLAAGSLLLLGSCGEKEGEPGTAETVPASGPASGEEDPLSRVPVKELNRDFTILNAGYCTSWLEEEHPDEVGSTRLACFRQFEESYKTTVYSVGADANDVVQGLRNVQMTGDTSYDFVYPHPTTGIVGMIVEGYFADLQKIETINLSGAGYNQSQIENYITNGKLYLCVPDLAVDGQGFFALVYNREVLKNYDFDANHIKDLVDSKKWTAEALAEMVRQTSMTGDTADEASRTYGLIFNTLSFSRWMYAMNERILAKDAEGNFVAGMANKNMIRIANALDQVLYSAPETVLMDSNYNAQLANGKMYNTFRSKRGLFITWDVGSCFSYLRELDFKKGYAPLPMLDDRQEDYRVVCASGLMGIPAITKSVSDSGLAMEFFSVYSAAYLRPVFFSAIIGGRLSEYPEDFVMLNLLHSKKFYDVGYTLDEGEQMLHVLKKAVIDNRNPDSIATVVRSNAAILSEIVKKANEMQ